MNKLSELNYPSVVQPSSAIFEKAQTQGMLERGKSMNFYFRIMPYIIGYTSLAVAATWLLGCFVQIHIFGFTVIGVEPNIIIRVGELGFFIYASGFAIYLFIKYIAKFKAVARSVV